MRVLVISAMVVFAALVFNMSAYAEATTPEGIALEFAEAYYKLDKSFEKYLCEECKVDENENKIVDIFFANIEKKSESLGYKPSYLKAYLSDMKAEVLTQDEESAVVSITGKKTRAINPVYNIFGRMFGLIEARNVDEVVNLVKVDGKWKVKNLSIEIL